jgi:hypothetical protein
MTLLALLLACAIEESPDKLVTDADGDGYVDDDCDDGDPEVHPGAAERCNGIDDDCDAFLDEELDRLYRPDVDGDGFGDMSATPVQDCQAPAGHVEDATDCDDTLSEVHPGAPELCDGLDNDCDGTGDADFATWYADADGDGYGDATTGVETCLPGASQVTDGTDCDDADPSVHPGAEEQCDYDDDNCDGRADQGVAYEWHTDTDGDGYGHMYNFTVTCDPEPGWVLDDTDCRPGDPEAYPGAAERCNDDDDNCDMVADEGMDADGDGHRRLECDDGDDCDDTDATTYPAAFDVCGDGLDQDCDGRDTACGYDGDYDLGTDADARLYSPEASYDTGRQISVGDADGDGIEDILIATLYADSYGGGGYIVTGDDFSGDTSLEDAGTRISGSAARTYGAGRSIGLADVNGDGYADAGFGAPYGSFAGMYIAHGPFDSDRNIATSYDVWLENSPGEYCGHGAGLGDLNGDGYADGVVGCYSGGSSRGGAVYVAYGPLDSGEEVDMVSDADSVIQATTPSSYAGRWVRTVGDHDGDGVGDLLIAAPYLSVRGLSLGAVYLVLGPPDASLSLTDADVTITGDSSGDYTGEGLAQGDINGDGLDDIVVCTPGDNTGGPAAGATHAFFSPVSASTDVSASDVSIFGETTSMSVGYGAAARDADGDGLGDLLFGAYTDSRAGAQFGAAFFFSGPAAGSYTTADAQATFLGAETGSQTGVGVGLADLDGDGFSEALIGAASDSTGGVNAGAVFMVRPSL